LGKGNRELRRAPKSARVLTAVGENHPGLPPDARFPDRLADVDLLFAEKCPALRAGENCRDRRFPAGEDLARPVEGAAVLARLQGGRFLAVARGLELRDIIPSKQLVMKTLERNRISLV